MANQHTQNQIEKAKSTYFKAHSYEAF